MTTQEITQIKQTAEKLDAISNVLLEHIVDFDSKLDEAMESFAASVEKMIEQKVAQRVEQRLKELGHD